MCVGVLVIVIESVAQVVSLPQSKDTVKLNRSIPIGLMAHNVKRITCIARFLIL